MNNSNILALDYFSGGVPAGTIFMSSINDLRAIVNKQKTAKGELNACAEVCFIGIIAYFEAFCKSHFASLINICPELIINIKKAGLDDTIKATELIRIEEHPQSKLGFLISERYNFSTSKKNNINYQALLNISPFSNDESHYFDRILNDRNLIVHHGGIYTMRYKEQEYKTKSYNRVFMDSLVVGEEYFTKVADFLKTIAEKLMESSKKSLIEFMDSNGIIREEEQDKALDFLTYYI